MKRLLVVLLLCVCVGGANRPTASQDVVPNGDTTTPLDLKAPDTCEVGELVRLDALGSDVDSIVWHILPQTPDFQTVADSRIAFFSARGPGEYVIFIAAAKGGEVRSRIHRLTVNGVAAPLTGLPGKVKSWLAKVPNFETKKSEALAVAGVFRKLADSNTKVDEMLTATAAANSAIVAKSIDKWIPFLDALGKELDVYVEAGELQTREQFSKKWKAIAAAIEYAAKG